MKNVVTKKLSPVEVDQIIEIIKKGAQDCIPLQEMQSKIESGNKLRIKLGMDPTAPDLHLGHAVVLKKMKQFQDLGHEVIFLIGDYTARIGDPTGKSKTRPPLTEEDIKKNAQTYFAQVGKILDLEKLTVVYNATWLSKLNFADVLTMCSKMTVARLIERDDFAKRLANNQPIALHELLYPVMQAYDSVDLRADVELGGTDQTFNLLCGRTLQEQYGQEPQVVITVPLLEGLDGVEKMSKSLGNAIGLFDKSEDAYGKLMSISDILMWRYFALLLDRTPKEIEIMQSDIKSQKIHPMDLKKQMAAEIITEFWSADQANIAKNQFESLFQNKDYSKATVVMLPPLMTNKLVWIVDVLKELGACASSSEAKRLLEAGAISVDDHVIKEFKAEIKPVSGMIIKAGKHKIYKIG